MGNYQDYRDRPICPRCGQPIAAGQSTMELDDCLIHLACLPDAIASRLAGDDPCEVAA